MNCDRCGLEMYENNSGVSRCPVCGRLDAIGVPRRYTTAMMGNGPVPDALRSGDSVLLHGATGRGKTHSACAMLREYVARQVAESKPVAALFRSLPELLLDLRETYRRDSEQSERDVLDRFGDTRLLVLDDVGAEKTSEAVRSSLYLLIDRRGNDPRLRTVLTSNLTLDELAESHGHPIASRIAGMCRIIQLTGPDRRLTQGGSR